MACGAARKQAVACAVERDRVNRGGRGPVARAGGEGLGCATGPESAVSWGIEIATQTGRWDRKAARQATARSQIFRMRKIFVRGRRRSTVANPQTSGDASKSPKTSGTGPRRLPLAARARRIFLTFSAGPRQCDYVARRAMKAGRTSQRPRARRRQPGGIRSNLGTAGSIMSHAWPRTPYVSACGMNWSGSSRLPAWIAIKSGRAANVR